MTTETNAERLENIARDIDGNLLEIIEVLQQKENLAERAEELERKLNEIKDGVYWDELQLLHWKAENARLREALEFYADKQSYEVNVTDQWEPVMSILQDDGRKAGLALKGESS